MISSKNILTVGPEYKNPKGGIAQVLYSYNKFVYNGFKHVRSGGGSQAFSKLYYFGKGLVMFSTKLLFDSSIKVVHIHTASNSDFKRNSFYARIARLFNKKVILHVHGGGFKDYYSKNKSFVKHQLYKADAIVALSEYWRQFFAEDLKCKNVFVVHNIIPTPNYKPQKEKNIFNFLYLGHIYEKKGIFDLVSIIKDHRKEYKGRLMLHIGGGLYEVDRLLNILKEDKLDDVIKFEGWVSGDKKEELLNTSNAYILPSYAEGVPISILEAMSYHLPIIATEVGGIPSIVGDKNGILIEPGNKQQLKSAIDVLINSEQQREKMGEASYQISLEYQPQNVIKELNILYSSIGIK